VSDILALVKRLAADGRLLVSDHAYDELLEDGILAIEVIDGLSEATAIEDYPDAFKGPSVLTLQADKDGRPLHAVWGIPKGRVGPAVLVTAYRPDPALWSHDFRKRTP
jgi:hypothetical protein